MKFIFGGCLAVLFLAGCNASIPRINTANIHCEDIRSDESIKNTIEAKKDGLFLIYKDYLLEDPELRGKIVFQFSVKPEGSIDALEITKTDFNNPQFNKTMRDKFLEISFDPQDVCSRTLSYTFYFLSK